MKLKLSIVPLCECQRQMALLSWLSAKSDGDVWNCYDCKRSYFVPHTYVEAAVMPELRKDYIASLDKP